MLERIGDAFVNVPEGFTVHPRVKPVLEKRREMSREGKIDWAFAELLAFGSLVDEGKIVRLSGQDSRRGTFTQRHSVLIDRKTGAEYTPLQNLGSENPGKFLVYDSRTQRVRRRRLRVRLLRGQPGRTGAVGGAVR